MCRNTYHNRHNRDETNYMRKVNSILRKNRKIIANLNPQKRTKVQREILQKKGFDFHFNTHIYTTPGGNVYKFCYEQGYSLQHDGFVWLLKKPEFESRGY